MYALVRHDVAAAAGGVDIPYAAGSGSAVVRLVAAVLIALAGTARLVLEHR